VLTSVTSAPIRRPAIRGDEPHHPVGRHQADPRALARAQRQQRAGHLGGATVELGIGHHLVGSDDRLMVAPFAYDLCE